LSPAGKIPQTDPHLSRPGCWPGCRGSIGIGLAWSLEGSGSVVPDARSTGMKLPLIGHQPNPGRRYCPMLWSVAAACRRLALVITVFAVDDPQATFRAPCSPEASSPSSTSVCGARTTRVVLPASIGEPVEQRHGLISKLECEEVINRLAPPLRISGAATALSFSRPTSARWRFAAEGQAMKPNGKGSPGGPSKPRPAWRRPPERRALPEDGQHHTATKGLDSPAQAHRAGQRAWRRPDPEGRPAESTVRPGR